MVEDHEAQEPYTEWSSNYQMLIVLLKSVFLALIFSFLKIITLAYMVLQLASFAEAWVNIKKPYKLSKDGSIYQEAYTPAIIVIGGGPFLYAKIAHNIYVNSVFDKMYFLVTKKTHNWRVVVGLASAYVRNYCLYLVGVNYFFLKIVKDVIHYQDDEKFVSYLLSKYSNYGDNRKLVFVEGRWVANPNLWLKLRTMMSAGDFAALKSKAQEYVGALGRLYDARIETVPAHFSQKYVNKFDLINNVRHLVLQNVGVHPHSIYMTDFTTLTSAGGNYSGTVTAINKFDGLSKLSSGVSVPTHDLVLNKSTIRLPQKNLILGMQNHGYNPDYINPTLDEGVQNISRLKSEILFLSQNNEHGAIIKSLIEQTILGANPPTPEALEAELALLG